MEEEHSPMIDIVGDMSKATLPEASAGSSTSDASSWGAASDAAEADIEDVIDPRKLAWSYDFGASLVTVGRIRQLESLGYFTEGSTCELGEEIVLELNTDDAVVFKEIFAAGLWMLPHPAFTDILHKFWVQLH
jgi:hypothetical protein